MRFLSAGCGGKPRRFGARTYNNRFKSRAGRAGTKTCRLLRIIAYMFLPLKRGVMYSWKVSHLPRKLKFVTAISQMTENGAPIYAGFNHYRGEAIFTSTLNTCYFEDKTLVKVKGGGLNDSNYKCSKTGEFYRVMKFDRL